MTTETKTLKLDQIRIDGGTQPRVAIDQGIVNEYAEQYSTGVDLRPVIVYFDGATYWLADGFHRYWANKKINSDYIFGVVHKGTQRDAILHSVGANATHGLRRTNGDKRKAVLTMLTNSLVSLDEEGNPWSDNAIAKRCQVSPHTVASARSGMQMHSCATRKGTDGKVYDTSNIGRKKRAPRNRKPGGISPNAMMPTRQPRPALAQTNLNIPHDPVYGARAIVAALGVDYARQLIDSLTSYLRDKKEGNV